MQKLKTYLTLAEQAVANHKTRRPSYSFRGQDTQVPSLKTLECNTAPPKQGVYTGTKMLGVATMHKSNAVPVFEQQAAIEISNMRR